MRCGFPTEDGYAHFHHIVEVVGLCRDRLGRDRFCEAYPAVRGLAARIAPLRFIIEPVRDWRHIIIGYRFMFENAETAEAFREQAADLLTASPRTGAVAKAEARDVRILNLGESMADTRTRTVTRVSSLAEIVEDGRA